MGRSVRISEEGARALAGGASEAGANVAGYVRGLRELNRALARLDRVPKSKPPRKKKDYVHLTYHEGLAVGRAARSRKPSKEEKRDETAELWKQAMARSGGFCECGCGRVFADEGENKPEMDHEASRRVPQTITNVWMLALVCHRQRQRNAPSETWWLRCFLRHCQKHGYLREAARVEARIAVVAVKSSLPAAPRLTNG